MKKSIILSSLIVIFTLIAISQQKKLEDYFNPKDVKNYDKKVEENTIYKAESKYIVHNFEIFVNNQSAEKGVIFRQFVKKGAYESFYLAGNKNLVNVGYWNDPTALVTANYRKSSFCVEDNINACLFPMIIRGYSKVWKEGTLEKSFKNIKFKLEKSGTVTSNKRKLKKFRVITVPNIMEGTISFTGDGLVAEGDLDLHQQNISRSGLREIFSFEGLDKKAALKLKFDLKSIDNSKPKNFKDLELDIIVKNFKKIDCE